MNELVLEIFSNEYKYDIVMNDQLQKEEILGVRVTNESRHKILEYVDGLLERSEKKYYFVTPNPEILVLASKDKRFQDILNDAEVSLIDGVGLTMAGMILGVPLKERFSGTDFVAEVCKRYARKPVSIGFLGGKNNVAELTAKCLQEKYPGLNVVFISEEWNDQGFHLKHKSEVWTTNQESRTDTPQPTNNNHDSSSIIPDSQQIDILFVAFGFPKQEKWIVEHLPKLPIKIAIGVGGAFDYISGAVPRAPRLWQACGMEWLFRLIQQPWRWRRQISLVLFIFMVIKARILDSLKHFS